MLFLGKFGVRCFLVTSVLRLAFLSYYRRTGKLTYTSLSVSGWDVSLATFAFEASHCIHTSSKLAQTLIIFAFVSLWGNK